MNSGPYVTIDEVKTKAEFSRLKKVLLEVVSQLTSFPLYKRLTQK